MDDIEDPMMGLTEAERQTVREMGAAALDVLRLKGIEVADGEACSMVDGACAIYYTICRDEAASLTRQAA